MKSPEQLKSEVARQVGKLVEAEPVLLLGSGTTVNTIIPLIRPTTKITSASRATSLMIRQHHLHEIPLDQIQEEPRRICIDGADQIILPQKIIIKGHGGALFREKISWKAATHIIVAVDESKIGDKVTKSIPVVITPFATNLVMQQLRGREEITGVSLYAPNGLPYNTDDGMHICHINVNPETNLEQLDQVLHLIPGIIETGLFFPDRFSQISVKCATQNGIRDY